MYLNLVTFSLLRQSVILLYARSGGSKVGITATSCVK